MNASAEVHTRSHPFFVVGLHAEQRCYNNRGSECAWSFVLVATEQSFFILLMLLLFCKYFGGDFFAAGPFSKNAIRFVGPFSKNAIRLRKCADSCVCRGQFLAEFCAGPFSKSAIRFQKINGSVM